MKLPRVYPILDAATVRARGIGLVEAAQALLDGGAEIVQLRLKGHWSREIFSQAQAIADLCRATETALIVNDRADMALLLGAGVHVGQDDLLPADARKVIGGKAVLGFSTHTAEQLREASKMSISYAAIGPVYPTQSKENPDPVIGVETLRRLRADLQKPLVAIGGITLDNALATLEAGADSVAVIAALYPDPCSPKLIRERMEKWQRLAQN